MVWTLRTFFQIRAQFSRRFPRCWLVKTNQRSHTWLASQIFLVSIVVAGLLPAQPGSGATAGELGKTEKDYGNLPLHFERNVGQFEASRQFMARSTGYTVSLNPSGATLQLRKDAASNEAPATLQMELLDGNKLAEPAETEKLPGIVNYLVGNDPAAWRTKVPIFGRVRYRDVYRGVDLVYYGNQRQLEYDFVVAPGADPRAIRMRLGGARKLSVDDAGDLVIELPNGEVLQRAPLFYQTIDNARHSVSGRYVVGGDSIVGFVIDSYDQSKPLVIDPILIYSTYLGGTDKDHASAIAVDASGNAYITGSSASLDLPTTAGALERSSTLADVFKTGDGSATWAASGIGLPNAFISALAVDPTTPSTVYAGTKADSPFVGQGVFKSTDGGAHWAAASNGLTNTSINRLVIDPVTPANIYAITSNIVFKSTDHGASWSAANNGLPSNLFIACFAIDPKAPSKLYLGSARSVYGSTNGGANWSVVSDDAGTIPQALAIDPTNSSVIYLGGGASYFGGDVGGVFKSTDAGATWKPTGFTFTGGFTVHALAIDPTNHSVLYLSETSISNGQRNQLHRTTDGGATWQIILTGDGNSNQALVNAIAVAPTSPASLYLATGDVGVRKSTDQGTTIGPSNLPVQDTRALTLDPTNPNQLYAGTRGVLGTTEGANNAFVAKLNPAGTALVYLTYLSGIGDSEGKGIAVDSSGSAYITGSTVAGTFPTTPGALQATPKGTPGTGAGFVSKLKPDGSGLVYSTYLSGSESDPTLTDAGHAIAVDTTGRAVVVGLTTSADFPTTAGAYPASSSGAFVTQLDAAGAHLVYSTILGQHGDSAEAVALDSTGHIYITGSASAFPTTGSAFQGSLSQAPGAFFAQLDPAVSGNASLLYSTYLNGTGSSKGRGIAVDGSGKAYLTGNTTASDFPIKNGFQTTFGGGPNTFNPLGDAFGDAFVVKMDPGASGPASLVYSSFLGGTDNDSAYAITLDSAGKVVVTGGTLSSDFISKNGFQPFQGLVSAFVARVDPDLTGAASLLYSTFLGGSNDNAQGHGIAADKSGNVYVTGFTAAPDFPTKNAVQTTNHGLDDSFVTKISSTNGSADLAIAVNGTPNPVTEEDNITYTITVTNKGPAAATGVVVSDVLDANATFVSATPVPATNSDNALIFALGTIQSGAQARVTLVAQVGPPANPQQPQISNTAIVHSDLSDPVLTNNTGATVNTVHQRFVDLKIDAASLPNPVAQGRDFTYKLTVTNLGPDSATGIVVNATLPTQVQLLSSTPAPATQSGQILTFNLPGSLAKNASKNVSISVRPNIESGFLGLSANVQSHEADIKTSNNSTFVTTVIAPPDTADVQVTETGPEDPTPIGNLTYHLTVTNNGPHGATGVVVTDAFTAGTHIVSVAAPAGVTTSQANSTVTCDIGNLLVGATIDITIVISAPTDAVITNTPTVSANERDALTSNNSPGDLHTTVRNGSLQFVVVNTNDSGPGSLRQAVLDSNAIASTPTLPNKIIFNIPNSDPGRDPTSGVFTIIPIGAGLGALFHPAVIDGYTQPGAKPNTNGPGLPDNAKILIELDGSQCARPTNGFTIYAPSCTVRGLAINRFVTKLEPIGTMNYLIAGNGIDLEASHGTIEGCFLGTDASGTIARGNEVAGVVDYGGESRIGGTDPAQRNVISGNGIFGAGSSSGNGATVIEGNFLGTDISGAKGLPTNILTVLGFSYFSAGVDEDGLGCTIGGTTPAARNVISGNSGHGVEILLAGNGLGTSADHNVVEGNYIGTDLTGKEPVPNGGDGVVVEGANNIIGGTTAAARNIISGNSGNGVSFFAITTNNSAPPGQLNVIEGNFIGTDVTGLEPLGNAVGVFDNGRQNTIGGTTAGAGNLISANVQNGITIQDDTNTVAKNSIGLDLNDGALGNGADGISILGLPRQTATGAPLGKGNLIGAGNAIAFNGGNGVTITSFEAGGGTGNAISGNSIFSNRFLGIDLEGGTEDAYGVTANHAGGPVTSGPNQLQNYPVLTSAVSSGGATAIKGTLNSAANANYTIEFYSNQGGDPSGFGEGQDFVGSLPVTTDASGNASFTTSIPMALGGLFISATATTPNVVSGSDTSEFAKFILATGAAPNPPPIPAADLGITGSASPSPATTNNPLTYTFTVTNHGPNTAPTVVITDTLPATLSFVSATTTRGSKASSGNTVSFNLGNMAKDATATVTITTTPTSAGSISNTASVSSNATDSVATNNSKTITTQVSAGVVSTDLVVSQVAVPSPVKLGNELVYTITVTTKGSRAATNVSLTDTLPGGVTFSSDDSSPLWLVNGSTATLFFGALAVDDSFKAFVAVTPGAAGTITNKVVVSLAQSDLTPADNTSSLQTSVLKAPSVTVLDSAPSSSGSNKTTYTATVTSTTTGSPTGMVTFRQGSTVLGTVTVDKNGHATLTITPPAGATAVTAAYQGDGNLLPSSSDLSPIAVPAQLLNIATRLKVQTDANVLIGGFIITGTDPKKVLIRGIGPSLSNFFSGILADPTLELHQGSTTLATNDNWKTKSDGTSQQAEIAATTIPPTNDLESAILATLAPGAYTAILAGKSGGTGIGVVEVYDLDQAANSKLANISTRGFVDTDNNVLIGGLIVGGGSGGGTAKVIVRALGPSVPVDGALGDPTLELHNGSGPTIATDDNWKTRLMAAASRQKLRRRLFLQRKIWNRPWSQLSLRATTPPSFVERITRPASVWWKFTTCNNPVAPGEAGPDSIFVERFLENPCAVFQALPALVISEDKSALSYLVGVTDIPHFRRGRGNVAGTVNDGCHRFFQ